MNEIEKMYENAGIKPTVRDNAICRGYYIEHQRVEEYPPFTADKQIDLIKWLAKKSLVVYNNLGGWNLGIALTQDEVLGIYPKFKATNIDSLKEAIAGLINNFWQFLTEEEKQQIKEILNGQKG